MPLSEEEKDYIADRVVEILRMPDKKERIDTLRRAVLEAERGDDSVRLDDAVYAVLAAIEELYG